MGDLIDKAKKKYYTEKRSKLKKERTECTESIGDLKSSKSKVEQKINKWEGKQKTLLRGPAGEIYIKDSFEGIVAKNLSDEFPEKVEKMERYIKKAKDISKQIDVQISSLQRYKTELNADISELTRKIAEL
ncbi:hypothetical protein [Listeria ilorinensis]|uniref:hypothetical protein n=1 Tax=Listeria ilorinensis TaxID=2867439 RepID=UPI001EF4322A|nr:hypothetical protein [Listeria ilorinensis]